MNLAPALIPARLRNLLVLAAGIAALAVQGWAHGDLHDQIEAVTAEIARSPRNAPLYLKRAELRRLHRDFDEALSDYQKAQELDASLKSVHLGRGLLFRETGRLQEARVEADRFLSTAPKDPRGLLLRARTLAAMKRDREAAEQFRAAMSSSTDADPDMYLEYAGVRLAAEGPEGAAAAIDEGVTRFGPIVSLISWAVDVELRHGRAEAALARLQSLPPALQGMPHWMLRRADILFSAARHAEAGQAYCQVLSSMRSTRRRSIEQHRQQEQVLLKIQELQADCGLPEETVPPARASSKQRLAPE